MAQRMIFNQFKVFLQVTTRLLLFQKFLYLLDYTAFGFDCLRMRFPFIIGFDTGDTEIVDMDGDNGGNLYMAGTTTATELIVAGAQKSVFIAKYDQTKLLWLKIINHIEVD